MKELNTLFTQSLAALKHAMDSMPADGLIKTHIYIACDVLLIILKVLYKSLAI